MKGRYGGTYAHWQIGLEYARYLNKDLAIYMNEVFREHMDFLDNPAEGVARRIKDAVKIYQAQGRSDEWIAIRLFHQMPVRGWPFITGAIHHS